MTKDQMRLLGLLIALLPLIPSVCASARDPVVLDEELARSARIWVDGVPLFPPYTLAIVGDTALTVNGTVAHQVSPARFVKRHPHGPFSVLTHRADSTMCAARDDGLPDSVVAEMGRDVFLSDTACVESATLVGTQSIYVAYRSGGRDSRTYVYIPKGRPVPVTREQLVARIERARQSVETVLDRGGTAFLDSRSLSGLTASERSEDGLIADIREAAGRDSITRESWAGRPRKQRVLSLRWARLVGKHVLWRNR